MLLGDRRNGLDQFDVGGDDAGGELHGAVALLLQVGGELVALAGHRALDPLHPPDRRVLRAQPASTPPHDLSARPARRRHADACPTLTDDADLLAAIGEGGGSTPSSFVPGLVDLAIGFNRSMTNDAEQAIEEEFGSQIGACERLYEYAKGLTTAWPGRLIDTTSEGLILTLFSRSLDTFTAAVRLSSLGYGAQASMLNRSLFEDMVDVHWIATEPEVAEQRYREHLQHGRMLLADAVARHPEHYEEIELPEFDPAERQQLDSIYGPWGAKPWSGLNLHERVKRVEHHWKDEASRQTLRLFHDIAHRENNQTLHVSSAGLNANAEVTDSGSLTVRIGPRPDMVDRALFGSFWIFDNTIGLVLDHFEIELDEKTRRQILSAKDFITLTEEQMRSGRNDPCLCGSGLKFKRCHGE